MRMNQKVNQMTNSLFRPFIFDSDGCRQIYFFCKKADWVRLTRRNWRGPDVLVFVKIIIEIYDFIALNGLLFLCHFIWFVWQLLLSPTFGFTRLQRTKGPVWKRLRENVQVFSFFLGSNSPCVESVYNLRSSCVLSQEVPFIVGSNSHGFISHKLSWLAFSGYLW